MTQVTNGKRPGPFLLGPALQRLSAKIAPMVRAELIDAMLADLEGHFNDELLPQLPARVEAIIARELPQLIEAVLTRDLPHNVEAVLARELPQRVDALVARELPERVEAIVNRLLPPKQSLFYLPNNIVAGTAVGEYMAASNALARDFLHPEYQEFGRLGKETVAMHRKPWEWAFVYQRLRKAGVLVPGMRGLGFGVGTERLPSLFASLGINITATDAPDGGTWQTGGVYGGNKDSLFYADMINRETFDDRISFEFCDMNEIPSHLTDYDFCWSSCAFEHLGTLQNGIDFVINSTERSLKVGGIGCHTTELNLSSEDETIATGATVLYRRKDLERLCQMLEERGHWAEPLRIEPGTLPPDYLVDLPPYQSGWHLKVMVGPYVTTSVGIVVRRGR